MGKPHTFEDKNREKITPQQEDNNMRFITFMKRNYIHDDGPKGCLARSIKSDGHNFPIRTSKQVYRKYLEEQCHADEGILKAFDECFDEWKKNETDN